MDILIGTVGASCMGGGLTCCSVQAARPQAHAHTLPDTSSPIGFRHGGRQQELEALWRTRFIHS